MNFFSIPSGCLFMLITPVFMNFAFYELFLLVPWGFIKTYFYCIIIVFTFCRIVFPVIRFILWVIISFFWIVIAFVLWILGSFVKIFVSFLFLQYVLQLKRLFKTNTHKNKKKKQKEECETWKKQEKLYCVWKIRGSPIYRFKINNSLFLQKSLQKHEKVGSSFVTQQWLFI